MKMKKFLNFQFKTFSSQNKNIANTRNYSQLVDNSKNTFFYNSNLQPINQEKKLNKSLLVFYGLLHAPIYLISIPLALDTSNFSNMVDWARLSLRSISSAGFFISGINISSLINNLENEMKLHIKNNVDVTDENIKYEENKIHNSIYLSLSSGFINFFSTQVLINSAVLTNQIIFSSFFGLVISNVINLYVVSRKLKTETNFSYFRINLIIVFLNLVYFLFILKFIMHNKNKGLNRIEDEYRMTNLFTKYEIIISDSKNLEDEIEGLYSLGNTSPEDLRKIEEIYDKY